MDLLDRIYGSLKGIDGFGGEVNRSRLPLATVVALSASSWRQWEVCVNDWKIADGAQPGWPNIEKSSWQMIKRIEQAYFYVWI